LVGVAVGASVGVAVGASVGMAVGASVGMAVGASVGVGAVDGLAVDGLLVGTLVVGLAEVGALVSSILEGIAVAVVVGLFVCGRGIAFMHALLTCPPYAPVQQASWVV